MSTRFVQRIAIEIDGDGDGEPLVCLHGLGGTSNTWTPLHESMARFRCVRIDLPGSGRSSRVEGPLSIDRFVQSVMQVCASLGIERAHFVGHSLGTVVLFHLAERQPRLVRSLAAFGPLLAPPDAARAAIAARGARALEGGVEAMQEIADALVAGALSARTRSERPAAVAMVRESVMRQDADGYARSCQALAEAQPARVETIGCPVLLVTGQDDSVAPPQTARAIGERIEGARVVVVPQCGHWTPVEAPETCNRELAAFHAHVRP